MTGETYSYGGGLVPAAIPAPADPLPARVNDALAALSEAVTHARDQLPTEVAQAWADAERLVWERLGAS